MQDQRGDATSVLPVEGRVGSGSTEGCADTGAGGGPLRGRAQEGDGVRPGTGCRRSEKWTGRRRVGPNEPGGLPVGTVRGLVCELPRGDGGFVFLPTEVTGSPEPLVG